MLGKKDKDYRDAEAAGHIKSMPVTGGNIVESSDDDFKVIDNPTDFHTAIGHAQMAGRDYLEVSGDLFNYLVKNHKTPYLTYGNPGVKVFKEGTRQKIMEFEKLNPDEQQRRLRDGSV